MAKGTLHLNVEFSSPIERKLHAALLRMGPAPRIIVDGTGHASAFRAPDVARGILGNYIEPNIWLDDDHHDGAIYLYGSVSILTYRADFVLELDLHRRLVVECDGHDFHDRTKQQAAYDRARDRELLQLGFTTIRFTGSEITHSPERCADEAYRCLLAMHDVRRTVRMVWEDAIYTLESRRQSDEGIEEHW